jgi:hypothetical protein
MFTKSILIFFICSIIYVESKAQVEKKIQGTIINGITSLPIEGVFLKSKNNESNAITDNEGYFSMLLINNSSSYDSIIINALGYKSIKIPILILNKEPIKLYEDIVTLPEVIVQSLFNWDNYFIESFKLKDIIIFPDSTIPYTQGEITYLEWNDFAENIKDNFSCKINIGSLLKDMIPLLTKEMSNQLMELLCYNNRTNTNGAFYGLPF